MPPTSALHHFRPLALVVPSALAGSILRPAGASEGWPNAPVWLSALILLAPMLDVTGAKRLMPSQLSTIHRSQLMISALRKAALNNPNMSGLISLLAAALIALAGQGSQSDGVALIIFIISATYTFMGMAWLILGKEVRLWLAGESEQNESASDIRQNSLKMIGGNVVAVLFIIAMTALQCCFLR